MRSQACSVGSMGVLCRGRRAVGSMGVLCWGHAAVDIV